MKFIRNALLLVLVSILLISGCQKAQTATEETKQTKQTEQAAAGSVSVETARTDDFSMDYCKFGNGEKVLVILPGLSIQSVMGSADAIAQAYQPLTEDYTVYVFDTRKGLPSSYSVFDMAEDTVAIIHSLGLEKISVFGASYGGMAAMVMAVQDPELIDKVVLASTSVNLTEEEYQTVGNWVSLAEEGDAEKLYLAFGEAVYPQEVYEQSKDLLVAAAETVTEEELQKFIILAEGMKGFNVTEELDKIQCPVLAIGDKQDRVLGPDATENIGQYMNGHPGFELYIYDGYGHAVYDMAPDFKERMLNFLIIYE